jgi:hypothetical protein
MLVRFNLPEGGYPIMISSEDIPKIILVNPNRYEILPVAPLGLEYLCNTLDHEKIDFDILDLTFKEKPHEELKTFLESHKHNFIALQRELISTSKALIQFL